MWPLPIPAGKDKRLGRLAAEQSSSGDGAASRRGGGEGGKGMVAGFRPER